MASPTSGTLFFFLSFELKKSVSNDDIPAVNASFFPHLLMLALLLQVVHTKWIFGSAHLLKMHLR